MPTTNVVPDPKVPASETVPTAQSAGIQRAPVPNAPVVSVSARPVVSKPTMAAQANKAAASAIPAAVLARLNTQKFNTSELSAKWFHFMIYGPTGAYKSTTAAHFDTPENTRIILVRSKEQLLPIMKEGYAAFHAKSWADISLALRYPEALWPEWANLPNRTLLLDDITEAKDMAMEDNETMTDDQGNTRELKDQRQVVRGAKDDIREAIKSVLRKEMNFGIVALEKSYDVTQTQGQTSPDLPPSISGLVTTDLEYVFYVMGNKLYTDKTKIAGKRKNEKNREIDYIQSIFAKNKVPVELAGKIIKLQEPLNLRDIWTRIQKATAAYAAGQPVAFSVEAGSNDEQTEAATDSATEPPAQVAD